MSPAQESSSGCYLCIDGDGARERPWQDPNSAFARWQFSASGEQLFVHPDRMVRPFQDGHIRARRPTRSLAVASHVVCYCGHGVNSRGP